MDLDKIKDDLKKSIPVKQIGKILDIKPLDGGLESRNFLISTNQGKYVVKKFKNVSKEEIDFELSVLNRLKEKFDSFPTPIAPLFYIGDTPCVMYSFLSGRGLTPKDINISNVEKIASLLARMHKGLVSFIPLGKRDRFSIYDQSFINVFKTKTTVDIENLLNRGETWLLSDEILKLKPPTPKSIIHEDLEMENIFIDDDGRIKFIDFGEAYEAEIISDIATAIKELIVNNIGLDRTFINTFLSSYSSENPILDDTQLKMLYPLLVRRTMFMLSYFLYRHNRDKSSQLDKKIEIEINTLNLLLSPNDLNEKLTICP